MNDTTKPQARSTIPPESTTECAYAERLDAIRRMSPRVGPALAAALATEDLDPVAQAELAPRLYEAVKHG